MRVVDLMLPNAERWNTEIKRSFFNHFFNQNQVERMMRMREV